jgi:hypothetical protein
MKALLLSVLLAVNLAAGVISTVPELMKAIENEEKILVLEQGARFELTETVKLKNSQRIIGNSATFFVNTNIVALDLARRNIIRDLNFSSSSVRGATAIKSDYGPNMWVENVRIHGFKRGIHLNYTWIGSWNDVRISRCDVGVLFGFRSVNAMTFTGGHIGSCKVGVHVRGRDHQMNTFSMPMESNRTAILVAGESESLVIRGCYFEGNREATIRLDKHPQAGYYGCGTIIDGNWFVREKKCIEVLHGMETRILNNRFAKNEEVIVVGPAAQKTFLDWNSYRGFTGVIGLPLVTNFVNKASLSFNSIRIDPDTPIQ